MATNCSCTLSALRVLMRVEQLEGSAVPLERSLELMESSEVGCMTVLNCERCRQHRFSLASVTVLSACIIEWVRRTWLGDDGSACAARISLGNYDLDPTDAEMLSRELMALQLSHFSKVMALLKAALGTLEAGGPAESFLDIVHANLQQLRDYTQRIRALAAASD
ncbi:uncharacterized protein BKCO1_5300020 [Diplodia corticola]|uniref:Uncharacterized protein n=1 Tax=Diplodia corticola TaxID=236234 RepID=A0A1J9REM5_9PEZI|nr:uncharacterized protein BKCO1_5300020 [Diplodia corticola]OJD31019.1 hypothetical protein BKCO1_5300020 [Diplodia corticola]